QEAMAQLGLQTVNSMFHFAIPCHSPKLTLRSNDPIKFHLLDILLQTLSREAGHNESPPKTIIRILTSAATALTSGAMLPNPSHSKTLAWWVALLPCFILGC